MCDWETEVKMLTREIADRQAELEAYKIELEYARMMRDNASNPD